MYYTNRTYRKDLEVAANGIVNIDTLENCTILVTGASGLIGSFLLYINEYKRLNIKVVGSSRKRESLERRFPSHLDNNKFEIIEYDVNNKFNCAIQFDYIVHAASNAYPKMFSLDPVGTIMGNINGVHNLLEYGRN